MMVNTSDSRRVASANFVGVVAAEDIIIPSDIYDLVTTICDHMVDRDRKC